ncbi:hypothetical protein P3X46_012144 [Hevea brasiliensis]|uniref:Uncharacterized protein n=1 Tax=Hevea brasiliensis TaxID=3981 RepID=A0ABQ9M9Q1_HEVBR|nr:hypothetical protein P3X46_012144 [Hevea brasiliensis]
MAYNLILFLLITIWQQLARVMIRPLASSSNLIARLKLEEQSSNYQDSLIQLQACTGKISFYFFLNEETDLGHGCCQAVST